IYQSVCLSRFYSQRRVKLQGASMWRLPVFGMLAVSLSNVASAQSMFLAFDPAPETGTTVMAATSELPPHPISGFIEFLFGEPPRRGSQQWFGAPPQQDLSRGEQDGRLTYANAPPDDPLPEQQLQSEDRIDPRFLRQEVAYSGTEPPGTVVVDTPN